MINPVPKLLLAWFLLAISVSAQTITAISPSTVSPGDTLEVTLSEKPSSVLFLYINGKPISDVVRSGSDTKLSFKLDNQLVVGDGPLKPYFTSTKVQEVSVGPPGPPKELAGGKSIVFRAVQPMVKSWKRVSVESNQTNCTTTADHEDCMPRLGDSVLVTVENSAFKAGDKILMWIDGMPLRCCEAAISQLQNGTQELTFYWPRNIVESNGKSDWLRVLRDPLHKRMSQMSVGPEAGPALLSQVTAFPIRRISNKALGGWGAFFVVVLIAVWWIVSQTALLREDSGSDQVDIKQRAYSLAKTQMLGWTLVVALSYSFIWSVTWTEDILNAKILVLLGISLATTALGATVDNSKKEKAKEDLVANNEDPSATAILRTPRTEWFLVDLISDVHGPAVSRVQMVLFTLILMVIFVAEVAKTLVMPEFSDTLLGLMGLSSAGYLTLKLPEKKG